MNKEYIIRKNEDIVYIIKKGKKNVSKYFIIYNIESKDAKNKYCISVSKKLGKAHTRNKLKRRVKDILMKNKMSFHRNYVIILKKEVLMASYKEMSEILIKQIKGEENEKN